MTADYRDRVAGCWLGKSLGGTLGMPYEGCQDAVDARFEDLSGKPLPNDDLELQLLWLWVLEQRGAPTRAADLARAAADHYICYPDEYGVARWNTWRGFVPPMTGFHNNWFGDGMGAAIRSEIWACLFPGRPALAAAYAREDALVDHHGNGVWAEMFLAAAESAAFATRDLSAILASGLSVIPADSRLARALRSVIAWHTDGVPWAEARARVHREFGHHNFTDVTVNLSFILIGLLYGGGDFERSVVLAVNCGMDTDCTGATCGSLMGILLGASGLPAKWRAAGGDEVAMSPSLRALPLPATLTDLTRRTVALADAFDALPDGPLPDATPETAPPVDDPRHWLVFPVPVEESMDGEPASVSKAARDPASAQAQHAVFHSIHLDLAPYVRRPGDMLYLLTWLRVERTMDAQLMLCADTGITAWLDGRQILNYHGRRKALPAFHRTEGGATVPVRLETGRDHLLKVRLLGCNRPLGFTVALGDDEGRHLQPVRYGLPGVAGQA
ncbi:MAG TPA: ADP-ribosylglycohydrolase family protein [Kiritimatiellia bacterium]|nr:ADP-ribosylglycohydrolase family protein [Kiritimatiellia bacterium]